MANHGMSYRDRVVDAELARRLSSSGAVVVEGPKACGKTATARRIAVSEVLLDVDETARRALAVDPALVLEGNTPRLIDEWQVAPVLWNHIRRAVDARGRRGGHSDRGAGTLNSTLASPWDWDHDGNLGIRVPALRTLPVV